MDSTPYVESAPLETIRLTERLFVEIRQGYARFVGDDGTRFTMTTHELGALYEQLPRIHGTITLQHGLVGTGRATEDTNDG